MNELEIARDSQLDTTVEEQRPRPLYERHAWLFLALILLLGAVFRFTGVNWDEGQHLHPDERFLTMVETAIQIPTSFAEYLDTSKSPLNPYNRNVGLFVYGTAPLFLVKFVGEIVQQTGYGEIHLIGRVLSGLADLLVVALTFFVGRRLYGTRAGLLAAFFYTCAVLGIQQSHFFTVDTFASVPILLAFWFALDIAEGKRGWLAYVLTGAFFGLALASRINLAAFAGIIALAAVLRLISLLGNIRRAEVSVPALEASRTFAFAADVVADGAEPGSASAPDAQPGTTTRVINLGPLVIEIETKEPGAAAIDASGAEKAERAGAGAQWWNPVLMVAAGLVLTVLATILVFRLTQPYAFRGAFGLNSQFLDNMATVQRLVSGEDDYPPSHQWAYRTPYWFPYYNIVVWGLGLPLGLAATFGVLLAAIELVRYRKWTHLLIVFWILGLFLYQGRQFVMTMRYSLPLYPFLGILAAYGLFRIWDWARAWQQERRGVIGWLPAGASALLLAIVAGYTVFWAGAFTTIYTRPVTRVEASRWIYANLSDNVVVGNEHWDDPLPLRIDGKDYFGTHQGVDLEMYNEDTPEKREQMIGWLDKVDYIFLSSNRLYGSIPRLPMRYPLTTKYYEWLFDGTLGFEKAAEFTSSPQLFGITINDDSSEEAFTVYDHPKVLIYKKTAAYSSEKTAQLFNSVDLSEVLRLKPLDAMDSRNQFRMSAADLEANSAGGTWSELFNPEDAVNQNPLVVWLALIWVVGLVAFPYTFVVFRRFADRGYTFAKALGILGLAFLPWTASSYNVLPFSREVILGALGVIALGGLVIFVFNWRTLLAYVRANWRILVAAELVYLVFFAIDLAIRYGNPDLWHPSFGGEKPMDFAYLNATIKTTYMPPYNPWYAGSFINYYYFGQLISATLVKLTGIVPEVAYNLLLPMFFGLTASGAFGVAFNLVAAAQGRSRPSRSPKTSKVSLEELAVSSSAANKLNSGPVETSKVSLKGPIAAGLFAAFLVLIIGNLGQVGVLGKGLMDLGRQNNLGLSGPFALFAGTLAWLAGGQEIPIPIGNWYWTATRVIPDTINEFPFFTFLYADLHAHLMSLPFTLVGLGLAVHTMLNRARLKWYDLGVLALVLGALRAINTWDYPTYLAVIGAAMVIGYFCSTPPNRSAELSDDRRAEDTGEVTPAEWVTRYLWFGVVLFIQIVLLIIPTNVAGTRITIDVAIYAVVVVFGLALGWVMFGSRLDPRRVVQDLGWPMVAIIGLSIALYWPYVYNYGTAYSSVELWKDKRTNLFEYLVVHGIFLFMIASVLITLAVSRRLRAGSTPSDQAPSAVSGWQDSFWLYLLPALLVLEVGLILLGLTVFAFVLPLVLLGLFIVLRRDTGPEQRLVTLFIVAGLLMTLMVETITLKGDIGRMNTVFKFYLQAWVLFGVMSAAGLALVFDAFDLRLTVPQTATPEMPKSESAGVTLKSAWWGVLSLLIAAGLVYPIFATWAKVNDRYVSDSPPGLNGMTYMQEAVYSEKNHDLPLVEDYQAIQWMRENIQGSPVVLEGNAGLYHWGNRVSIYTGLPTVAGWDWHTKQQYSLLPGDLVDQRVHQVGTIYTTGDPAEALALLQRFDVSYIYVGAMERVVYGEEGLSKFQAMTEAGALEKVYDADGVQIYKVKDEG